MHKDLLLQCASEKTEQAMSRWVDLGFRFGDRGTHTSRTIMLDELSAVLAHCPPDAPRSDYATEIIEHNLLGKRTASTRRLTNQRLGELYGLDPDVPLFRLLRHFWAADDRGRPLLAVLTALARDPLLRATTPLVLSLDIGQELVKSERKRFIHAQDKLSPELCPERLSRRSSRTRKAGDLGRALCEPTVGELGM